MYPEAWCLVSGNLGLPRVHGGGQVIGPSDLSGPSVKWEEHAQEWCQGHVGRCLDEDLDATPGLGLATMTASQWELQGRQAI